MNRDDIIRMAREAATEDGSVKRTDGKNVVIYAAKTNRFLERFAALVAAAEREACAIAAESVVPRHTECGNKIAATIRARGGKND